VVRVERGWTRCFLFTANSRVQSHVTSCEIRSRRCGISAGLSPSFFGFLLSVNIPPLLHTHPTSPPDMCDSPHHAAQYHIISDPAPEERSWVWIKS
jgi:hypothetical protein